MKYHSIYAVCSPVFFSSLLFAQDNTPTVQTSSGAITGHAAQYEKEVSEYLGIPYARPPIGDLRFAAPQTFNSTAPFDAKAYSPDCPQTIPPIKYPGQTPQFDDIVKAFGGGRGNPQSEDCLTLNVWSKSSSNNGKGVLLWFHGGRFTLGDTNTPFYDGQFLAAAQDLVVVTANYRLNIFGFSGAPSQPANAGLLDQRKAVEWVRDNIAAFGGDPKKISIWGQSAGGSAVDYYAYAYPDDPIVSGLISVSGTAESFEANTPDFARQSFLAAAKNVSCSGSDEDVVACMRKVDTKTLQGAIAAVKPLPSVALSQAAFHPTVDDQIVFNLSTYRARGEAGQFAKIPYMAGNNDHESGWYRLAASAQKIQLTDQQWNLFELEGFTCASRDAVAYRAKHGLPAFRWRYFGDFDNTRLYDGSGAYHGVDLHMIFGASWNVTGLEPSQAQKWTTQYMQGAWAAFVSDPPRGLVGMGWPLYEANGEGNVLVRLGLNDMPSASFVSPAEFDEGCPSNGSVKEAQGAF